MAEGWSRSAGYEGENTLLHNYMLRMCTKRNQWLSHGFLRLKTVNFLGYGSREGIGNILGPSESTN